MSPYLSEILKLSIPERILLVEAIWDSIVSESNNANYHLTAEQVAFLEEELESYAKNPSEGKTWEEIKKKIQAG
jgi:putative addiction module component (TIGR02574 family)